MVRIHDFGEEKRLLQLARINIQTTEKQIQGFTVPSTGPLLPNWKWINQQQKNDGNADKWAPFRLTCVFH